MGEAEAKQQEAMAEAKPEEKKEEKPLEEKKEEKPHEEKKEEAKPSPPPPTVLFLDLHCVGCARKIERAILKCKGVEEVEVDMAQNQVTVKGIVNPEALCSRIQKKTLREAKVLSPLPPPEGEAAKPEAAAAPEVTVVPSVELHVNMHCEACAQQLRRKILKMRGVQAVETVLGAKKVTVTGTMSADKLVEYIHRRTGKLAKVIPPPPPPPEEGKKEEAAGDKKPPEEEKKEEGKTPQEQGGNAEGGGKEEKGSAPADQEQPKKEGEGALEATVVAGVPPEDDMAKKLAYWYGGGMINDYAEEMGKRGTMVQWMPVYLVDDRPPPQIFSDENPNACCIS